MDLLQQLNGLNITITPWHDETVVVAEDASISSAPVRVKDFNQITAQHAVKKALDDYKIKLIEQLSKPHIHQAPVDDAPLPKKRTFSQR